MLKLFVLLSIFPVLALGQEIHLAPDTQTQVQLSQTDYETRENLLAYMRGEKGKFDQIVDFGLLEEKERDVLVAQMAESIALAPSGWYQVLVTNTTFAQLLNQLGLLPENVEAVGSCTGLAIIYYVP